MMPTSPLVVAVAGLIGVLIGGLLRAIETWNARRHEATALLSGLSAEVEALTRLIHHRDFLTQMISFRDHAAALVRSGSGDTPFPIMTITVKSNYFAIFEASTSKIGLIDPFYADRITRFYTYVKAAHENYHPESMFQNATTAADAEVIYTSDIDLLKTALQFGEMIGGQKALKVPKGIIDPFLTPAATEPKMPGNILVPPSDRPIA